MARSSAAERLQSPGSTGNRHRGEIAMLATLIHLFAAVSVVAAESAPTRSLRSVQTSYQEGVPGHAVLVRNRSGSFPAGEWSIVDSARKTVRSRGRFPPASRWNALADSAVSLDLPAPLPPGRYLLIAGKGVLGSFGVSRGVDRDVFRATMKAFYHNRAGNASVEPYADRWKRPAGHPDTLVRRHASTGRTGTLSSPKGWYDAGDYGKYIVNSGITCWTLLDLAESYPGLFDTLSWPIPAGPEPALLREVRWNLDWMLTMQDQDGGVHHKLTTLAFDPMDELPHQDLAQRFVVMKTTAATLDFASVFYKASRVYASKDSLFASRCRSAAERAWNWAVAHPAVFYQQPVDVKTGKYEDTILSDERLLAAVERRASGGEEAVWLPFREHLDRSRREASWQDVGALALLGVIAHPKAFGADTAIAMGRLLERAGVLRDRAEATAFGVSIDSSEFVWGSNAVLANQGILLLEAFRRSGDSTCLRASRRNLDYLLGVNPFDSSFVTGIGIRPARNPHHRPSVADTIADPVPGFLVGGSHLGGQDVGPNPWQCPDYRIASAPALSWTDRSCSYATNEVAINWNAALAGLVGGWLALRECAGGCYSVAQ